MTEKKGRDGKYEWSENIKQIMEKGIGSESFRLMDLAAVHEQLTISFEVSIILRYFHTAFINFAREEKIT